MWAVMVMVMVMAMVMRNNGDHYHYHYHTFMMMTVVMVLDNTHHGNYDDHYQDVDHGHNNEDDELIMMMTTMVMMMMVMMTASMHMPMVTRMVRKWRRTVAIVTAAIVPVFPSEFLIPHSLSPR